MLCIFIVHGEGLIPDIERDLCDNLNNETDEQLALMELINKKCRSILFPGPNGTFHEASNKFSDEQQQHIRDLLIAFFLI